LVFDWGHEAVRRMLRLSGWTIGYVVANQIAFLFVLVLASPRDGAVSAYTYAYIFFQLPHGLFAVSLMTTITPELARAANDGDLGRMRFQFESGLRYLVVVVLPAAAVCVVLAQPIVGVLAHGAFGARDASVTADTLQAFAIGLLPFSVYLYVLRGFYALQDTRTPFIINAFENALNIALAVLLFSHFGVQGLALAFAGAYVVAAAVSLVALGRRIGGGPDRGTASVALRAAAAAGILAVVAAPIAGAFGSESASHAVAGAVVGGTAGGLAYLVALRAFGVGEIEKIFGFLRRRRATAPSDV
jgi:putative peptidoglycan lipid II flippase